MNENSKIVFVVTAMGRGGAERVVSILSNHYASVDWKVHIIMLWHDIVGYELHKNVEVHCVAKEGGGNQYLKLPGVTLRLRKLLKKIKPSVVVSFIAENAIVSHYACMGLKLRTIASERNDPTQQNRGKLYTAMLNNAYAKSDLTVLQTKRVRSYFSPKVQENSVIICNPVTVRCQAGENRKKVIVTAGRLEKQKNHQMLVKAFAGFHERFPEYKLVIYGEGKFRGELEALVDKMGLKDHVFLPGSIPDVQEKEADAEFFVLSSDFEGMSNALMEAMAMGLPCISTACAGSDELISDRHNGLLVPVGNEEKLLEAMLYMAENRDEAEEMGRNARQFSKVYSTENVIEQWRSAIEGR